MASSISAASLAAQLERLSGGLAELHEGIVAMREQVQCMIESMLRSERCACELLTEIRQGVAQLRQFNGYPERRP